MKPSKTNDPKYRKRIEAIRSKLRGYYPLIAERSGMEYDTVVAVMGLRFHNPDVVKEAEKIYRHLTKV